MRKSKWKVMLGLFLMSLSIFSFTGCVKKVEEVPDIIETREVVHKETSESKEIENNNTNVEPETEIVVNETLPDELYKPAYLDEMENEKSKYNDDYNSTSQSLAITNSMQLQADFAMGAESVKGITGGTSSRSSLVNDTSSSTSELNINWNTEEYSHEEENRFMSVNASPFSTFGADVDTASYSLLRKKIFNNSSITKDAVRIEEMINYFDYDYVSPEANEPFSVTAEIAPCPWNEDTELLMLGLQAEKVEKEDLPSSNLVFLLDVSGSMDTYDKLPLVKQAFSLLTNELDENDTISIVTYAGDDRIVIEGVRGDEKEKIIEALDNLTADGGTAGADGINTAYKIAEKYFNKNGNNRIILATDGDLNIGVSSEADLVELVKEKADKDIFLSVMGFGTGNIKDNKMEALADNGNGNYSYIDSVMEAKRVLVDEMQSTLFTVAKDVKLQVEFNPNVVKGYRLIGYENRQMDAEDFADDTKDGGEIGAGHRVTVLYEIVKTDSDFEIPEVTSKYNNTEKESENTNSEYSSEWLTLNVRYKEPTEDKSILLTYAIGDEEYSETMSNNMSWAAGVAQVGMLLKESEYAGTSDYESVKTRLKMIDGVIDDEFKSEFIYLISRIQSSDIKITEE